jgi:hypothetical protein
MQQPNFQRANQLEYRSTLSRGLGPSGSSQTSLLKQPPCLRPPSDFKRYHNQPCELTSLKAGNTSLQVSNTVFGLVLLLCIFSSLRRKWMPKVLDFERVVTNVDSGACHNQHACNFVRHAENTVWALSEEVSVPATTPIISTVVLGQFLRGRCSSSCSFAAECSSNRALC